MGLPCDTDMQKDWAIPSLMALRYCHGLSPVGSSAPQSCLLTPPQVGWGKESEG